MSISKEELHWMYAHMYKIRYYEDKLEEVYMEGKQPVFNIGAGTVPGEMHLSTGQRSEEHTSELQSRGHLGCRLLREKKQDKEWKDITVECDFNHTSQVTHITL